MLDLPAIKKLCEAAPEGPWEAKVHCLPKPPSPPCTASQVEPVLAGPIAWDVAKFIAQARTLVPQLVEALEEAERRSHKGGWVCDCDCHEEIDGLEGADYKAQRQAEDAVGYEEEAACYDAEQAQQEADHRRDVARDEEIVTEEPGPPAKR
ncbi:hypothetical protein LCGC14_2335640 [marine sediment metagenome]|uniref:Uncharacterized protein n=2 Tax=marine sediment metagenome TaxID=412755 RepID=A0A0F9F8K9_9ZZZZ